MLAFHQGLLLELSDPQLLKGNAGSSALELSPQEIIFFFKLVDYGPFKDLVGCFVFDFEVIVVALKGKLGLILIKLFADVFHFFVGRPFQLFYHMLFVILILFPEGFQLNSEHFFLFLKLPCLFIPRLQSSFQLYCFSLFLSESEHSVRLFIPYSFYFNVLFLEPFV